MIGDGVVSAIAANGTAVWMSDFVISNENGGLLRAIVGSLVKDWWLLEPTSPQEPATVMTFIPMYGDTPESIELVLWLWYAF